MLYNSINVVEADKARERLENLIEKGKTFEIILKKEKITWSQTKYLYTLFEFFGMETGYTKDEVESIFKLYVNRDIYLRETHGQLGKIQHLRGTSELERSELSEAIERFRNYAQNKANIYLPYLKEEAMLNSIANAVKNTNVSPWIKSKL